MTKGEKRFYFKAQEMAKRVAYVKRCLSDVSYLGKSRQASAVLLAVRFLRLLRGWG